MTNFEHLDAALLTKARVEFHLTGTSSKQDRTAVCKADFRRKAAASPPDEGKGMQNRRCRSVAGVV